MERRSSDILFQQSVSSMSVETVRRVDSVLVLILRSVLLYLPGFALAICFNYMLVCTYTMILYFIYFLNFFCIVLRVRV